MISGMVLQIFAASKTQNREICWFDWPTGGHSSGRSPGRTRVLRERAGAHRRKPRASTERACIVYNVGVSAGAGLGLRGAGLRLRGSSACDTGAED